MRCRFPYGLFLVISLGLAQGCGRKPAGSEPRWTRWTWGGRADQEAHVSWEGDRQDKAWVELEREPGVVERIQARPTCRRNSEGDPSLECTYRSAVQGLHPSRSYRFRPVLANGATAGAWHELRTSPSPDACNPMRIVVVGDSRGRLSLPFETPWLLSTYWPSILKSIVSERPAALFHMGDIVADGRRFFYWRAWMDASIPSLEKLAFLPVVGNHEILEGPPASSFYPTLLAPPSRSPGLSWRVQAGRVLFVGLDTESIPVSKQLSWLEDTLRESIGIADFRIVLAHRPLFSSGLHGSNPEGKYKMEEIMPILERYQVDLFFVAHDHSYERIDPLHFNAATGQVEAHRLDESGGEGYPGVLFVTAGAGGAPAYAVEGCKVTGCVMTSSLQHYVVLDVLKDRIEATVRNMGPYGGPVQSRPLTTPLDRFILRKKSPRCGL